MNPFSLHPVCSVSRSGVNVKTKAPVLSVDGYLRLPFAGWVFGYSEIAAGVVGSRPLIDPVLARCSHSKIVPCIVEGVPVAVVCYHSAAGCPTSRKAEDFPVHSYRDRLPVFVFASSCGVEGFAISIPNGEPFPLGKPNIILYRNEGVLSLGETDCTVRFVRGRHVRSLQRIGFDRRSNACRPQFYTENPLQITPEEEILSPYFSPKTLMGSMIAR